MTTISSIIISKEKLLNIVILKKKHRIQGKKKEIKVRRYIYSRVELAKARTGKVGN